MIPPAAASADRITLYHQRHARRQRAKSLSHLAPAVVLLLSALGAATGQEPLSWITGAEFVIGAVYVGLLVREWRHLHLDPHHHERVAWLEIAAAGILALEGYHLLHRYHALELQTGAHKRHVLPYLYWALAGFYLWLAFNAHQLNARRHLHLHPDGFSGRLKPLGRAFHFRWDEVQTVEPAGAADVVVHRKDGREQLISLANMHDGPALRDRLVAHFKAMNSEQ